VTNPQRPPADYSISQQSAANLGVAAHPGLRAIAPEDIDVSFVNCFDARHFAVALGGLRPRPPGYGPESRAN